MWPAIHREGVSELLTLLFWNLRRKSLHELVWAIAEEHSVDIAVLAEIPSTFPASFGTPPFLRYNIPNFHLVAVFGQYPTDYVSPLRAATRFATLAFSLPTYPSFTLAVAHLPDRRNNSLEARTDAARRFAESIRADEFASKHQRTIVLGDLNMNPFEVGVYGGCSLNGVPTKRLAGSRARRIRQEEYPYFYNPMWGLLGDRTPGPPGTYYHSSADSGELHWHILDQCLLRPDTMHWLIDVAVIEIVREETLSTKAGIPRSNISDHFPVLVRLNPPFLTKDLLNDESQVALAD
jgi:hypothetical protein